MMTLTPATGMMLSGHYHANDPGARYGVSGKHADRLFRFCLAGLRSWLKMGLMPQINGPGETDREWGRLIKKDPAVTARIDAIWDELAIMNNGKL